MENLWQEYFIIFVQIYTCLNELFFGKSEIMKYVLCIVNSNLQRDLKMNPILRRYGK